MELTSRDRIISDLQQKYYKTQVCFDFFYDILKQSYSTSHNVSNLSSTATERITFLIEIRKKVFYNLKKK